MSSATLSQGPSPLWLAEEYSNTKLLLLDRKQADRGTSTLSRDHAEKPSRASPCISGTAPRHNAVKGRAPAEQKCFLCMRKEKRHMPWNAGMAVEPKALDKGTA